MPTDRPNTYGTTPDHSDNVTKAREERDRFNQALPGLRTATTGLGDLFGPQVRHAIESRLERVENNADDAFHYYEAAIATRDYANAGLRGQIAGQELQVVYIRGAAAVLFAELEKRHNRKGTPLPEHIEHLRTIVNGTPANGDPF
jgi:hypothetical protein